MEFFNHFHCKYSGIKGFVSLYNYALKLKHMITETSLKRMRILAFWEKHGLLATIEAFGICRRTLFNWKQQLEKGNGKLESLNNQSRAPNHKRVRLWPEAVVSEIKRLRFTYPNLGKDKIYPLLLEFCLEKNLICPSPKTIGRLIKDLGGLRIFPQKITHFGKIKPLSRRKRLIKPKDFKAKYPGHLVALDTIQRFVFGTRKYIITFEDIYTRFSFAIATNSHASRAAKDFFQLCQMVFPFPFTFVLTDNGSEFAKHFSTELKRQHLIHYHTYPKTPKQNAHLERFNKTIQKDFVDFWQSELIDLPKFNQRLIDWLLWYNTKRVHYAFQNKLSPIQFILTLPINLMPKKCNLGWPHTCACLRMFFILKYLCHKFLNSNCCGLKCKNLKP